MARKLVDKRSVNIMSVKVIVPHCTSTGSNDVSMSTNSPDIKQKSESKANKFQ